MVLLLFLSLSQETRRSHCVGESSVCRKGCASVDCCAWCTLVIRGCPCTALLGLFFASFLVQCLFPIPQVFLLIYSRNEVELLYLCQKLPFPLYPVDSFADCSRNDFLLEVTRVSSLKSMYFNFKKSFLYYIILIIHYFLT